MNVVETQDLGKTFYTGFLKRQPFPVLSRINFKLAEGEMVALMGPNGSGKTTFLKILATLILPSSGSVRVCGHDLENEALIRGAIALATNDDRSFFWRISCFENLRFFGILNNLTEDEAKKRIIYFGEMLQFSDALWKRYDQCSTGIKRRLAIARALMSHPRVLLLDEPTNSLDIDSAHGVRNILIEQMHEMKLSIIYVSHHIEEIKLLPCRLCYLEGGRLSDTTLEALDAKRHS